MRTPVTIMFHSIGLDSHDWSYPHIAEPPGYFEQKMAAVHKSGYQTVFFARDADVGGSKQIALTFDDGYLDNWVHAFPVLERYGLRATIFVTPDFVDPRQTIRNHVDPAGGATVTHEAASCCAGFLSWPELREMEKSGLVDVQCHGLTHTWYFKGPRIVDFWHPGAATERDGPVWMLWNERPELKPYYITKAREHESEVPYGTPIYEHGKVLETRRFYPDPALGSFAVQHVREHGGPGYFDDPGWRDRLGTAVDQHRRSGASELGKGCLESEREYLKRVRQELSVAKSRLEDELQKKVSAICWPGGGVSDEALETARTVGFRYFTLPSKWRDAYASGKYRDLTPRIGSKSRVRWQGRDLGRTTPREFIWHIEATRFSGRHRLMVRSALALRLAFSYLKPRSARA